MEDRIRISIMAAIFTALVTLVTMAFHIPVPATGGIINFGDTIIFTTALLLGRKIGFLAGGVGSALANLLLGLVIYAPFTLVIKGLEGLIAGHIGHKAFMERGERKRPLFGLVLAGLWMVIGYFLVQVGLFGLAAASVELPGNLLQAGVSILIALPLSIAVKKSGMIKRI